MKLAEADIVMVPGLGDSGEQHWQSRWQGKMGTARRVVQDDWDTPNFSAWTSTVAHQVNASTRPVVLIAHSLGVAAVAGAVPAFTKRVAGAFLVTPPELSSPGLEPASLAEFGPYCRDLLPFPAIVVASRNDPYSGYDAVAALASNWGALLVDAGEAGHINVASGHGPWPEGSMVFARFMGRLS